MRRVRVARKTLAKKNEDLKTLKAERPHAMEKKVESLKKSFADKCGGMDEEGERATLAKLARK